MESDRPAVRIPPAVRPPLATVVAAVAGRATHTEPHRIFTTLARHRRLFRRWLPLADILLLRGDLPRRDTELLILRTAWNCRCWYQWVQHAGLAQAGWLPKTIVDAIPDWREHEELSRRQCHLLQAADELHRDHVISDNTWELLADELSDTQLIEVCFVVGHYAMLAMTLNSLGVQPEPTAIGALDDRNARTAERLRAALASTRRLAGPAPRSAEATPDATPFATPAAPTRTEKVRRPLV
jgi:alkylhydroperoxidase family enzyme